MLSGRCLPYGEGITYWPLVEIFREADAEDELADALGPPRRRTSSGRCGRRSSDAARERPLALVVEDIHWAEPTLLDLLEHLVRLDSGRASAAALPCSPRADRPPPDVGRAGAGRDVALEPLSAAESDELIEELLERLRTRRTTTRARISDVAEGNPLFVEQLLAMLVEGGDPEHVPPTIQALLAARLDSLPDEERDVLERASVIGLEFEWEALGELLADRRRPSGAQLAALVRKELIRPHEAIEDTFRFRHLLIRDAAYERIPKELRSELHERFAGWLDARGEEFDEIVGYHLEQAYRCLAELGRPDERGRRSPRRPRNASPERADGRTPAPTCAPPRASWSEPPPCSLQTTRDGSLCCPSSAARCATPPRWSARRPSSWRRWSGPQPPVKTWWPQPPRSPSPTSASTRRS